MFAKYLHKYRINLVTGAPAPELCAQHLQIRAGESGPWARLEHCVFLTYFTVENSCSHTYVDLKMDRTPDAYLLMLM